MRIEAWALVPAKAPVHGKSRLAPILSSVERIGLQRAMLEDVLSALSRARRISGIAVMTDDAGVAAMARTTGAHAIAEAAASGNLSQVVADGVKSVVAQGATLIAVIPADVPMIDAGDVDRAIEMAIESGSTVVVPDRHGDGTNALVFHADRLPGFSYGPGSFARHSQDVPGYPPVLLPLQSLRIDIDTPGDLAEFVGSSGPSGMATRRFLEGQRHFDLTSRKECS